MRSFPSDSFSGPQARTLDRDLIGCVLLEEAERIEAGEAVHATGDVVRVPVGRGLLGRMVDPLGRPLDDDGPIIAERYEPVERAAPAIVDRDFVSEPVQTGVLVVDALFALGRVEAIRTHGAPERCIFVVAGASSAPGLQWLAPFAGFTMVEYFRDRGQHALVVVDDMTKHAATHREIALLTRQPPGREAFPGDVFHVHARLLERAAKLAPEAGGGSLTALPIAEMDAGNLSAYIPTNLISITDGQIVFDSRLFHEGQKPAVDVGTSVSRVGGKTQAAALRLASQALRLDYAQFLELEVFTRFGGMSDARVKDKIARGHRIRAALAQPQFTPLRLACEVALILALQEGLLDRLPAERVANFRAQLPGWLDRSASGVADRIDRLGELSEADGAELRTALKGLVDNLTRQANAQPETA